MAPREVELVLQHCDKGALQLGAQDSFARRYLALTRRRLALVRRQLCRRLALCLNRAPKEGRAACDGDEGVKEVG